MVPESGASDATSSGDPSSEAPHFLRVLIDTNVVLDWLLDRRPWSDAAKPVLQNLPLYAEASKAFGSCAVNAQLDLIVTRNPADFAFSPIQVIDPSQITGYLGAP
jgi:hypothetical protein